MISVLSNFPNLQMIKDFSQKVVSNHVVQVFLVKDETNRNSKLPPSYLQSKYIFSEKERQMNLQPLK